MWCQLLPRPVCIAYGALIHLSLCLHPCPQSLSHCELITDDGIRALSSSTCGQERLTVVELDNCPLITDVTLEHLKSCHRLERIELYDCQQVTRAGIKRIRVSGNDADIKCAVIDDWISLIWSPCTYTLHYLI